MEKNNKKLEELVLSVSIASERLEIPYKEAHERFMTGDLFVTHYRTHKPLHPSCYSEFRTVSQEARAVVFKNLRKDCKSQGQESGTCKIYNLLRRASQLRSELFVINKQLTETYGIALTDGFLSLQSKSLASQTPRQGGSKKGHSSTLYEISSKLMSEI